MAQADIPAVRPRPSGAYLAVQALAGLAIVGLLGFIGVRGWAILGELRQLQGDQARRELSAVVGYIGIHAEPNHARRPDDWCHDEGGQTLLWCGWKDGKHDWFKIARGDLATDRISEPMGRDVIRAIDHPIVEGAGGEHWAKIPSAALVAGLQRDGVRAAYPIVMLAKVEVINDVVAEKPLLVVYRPFATTGESVAAFAPIVDGRRITMGLSGYLLDRKPILYDRGTRSLWQERDGALVAVAGPLKGATLAAVPGVETRVWSDWRSRYPESRLVVGADRKKPRPEL
ncbi:MAG TPA: DUF3179 domain-containing (seleno)protein [Isosphaeraceae bacterium]|jgi:hypothetical protein